jgi:glycosyltransferase involved in cell wall biosynthesis
MRVVLELRAPAPVAGHTHIFKEQTAVWARAMMRGAGEHEVVVVVTHASENAVQRLRDSFSDMTASPNFHLARLPIAKGSNSEETWMREAADLLRENALLQFRPDVIVTASLTGNLDIGNISRLRPASVPVAIVVGDDHFAESAVNLGRADLLLVFSDLSERHLVEALKIPPEKVAAFGSYSDEECTSAESPRDRTRIGRQASRPSPESSVPRVFECLEGMLSAFRAARQMPRISTRKPRMAYVSPLPPERSGIADYSRELLPHLAAHYEIDLITDLPSVDDRDLQGRFRLVPVKQFRKKADRYERILYHIGNSPFHSEVTRLLARHPGTVVLHDFFLSHLFYHLDGIDGIALWRTLYESHGYRGLISRSREGAEAAVWKYPCNLAVLLQASGVIIHSEYARDLAAQWYGDLAEEWRLVPQLRRVATETSRDQARRALGIPPDTFLACSFGFTAPTKLNVLLQEGWSRSSLAGRNDCSLVFVGGDGEGNPFQVNSQPPGRVMVTGYVSGQVYEQYLAAADVAVQLRSGLSRGETPRSVLDCMAHGLATVVNDHPIVADLPAESVLKISANPGAGDIAAAIERLHRERNFRAEVGRYAQQHVREARDPALVARLYSEVLEEFAGAHPESIKSRAIEKLAKLPYRRGSGPDTLAEVASCLSEGCHNRGPRQLLVDVTVLFSLGDYQTGIHRVTRAILSQLIENPPGGYRVEPVYRPYRNTYRYARSFTAGLLGVEIPKLEDAPVAVNRGDVFLGLDWDPGIDDIASEWLMHHRRRGMRTVVTIYDLLPLQRSEWFKPEMEPVFREWISRVISVADTCVCISRAVADELMSWLDACRPAAVRALDVAYFHLGSDVESSLASQGVEGAERAILETVNGREVIAMIGTVEPRKGHLQALEAMQVLWEAGERTTLVICGKQGWMVESIAERIRNHREMGSRLFWMDQASDQALLQLYSRASAVLMASEGEGFGLPLVEAAKHGAPIIARDLPVFREVAGAHAFYFSASSPAELADALRTWLQLYRRGEHPKSNRMPWLTWKESTKQLLQVVLDKKVYRQWRAKHNIPRTDAADNVLRERAGSDASDFEDRPQALIDQADDEIQTSRE